MDCVLYPRKGKQRFLLGECNFLIGSQGGGSLEGDVPDPRFPHGGRVGPSGKRVLPTRPEVSKQRVSGLCFEGGGPCLHSRS